MKAADALFVTFVLFGAFCAYGCFNSSETDNVCAVGCGLAALCLFISWVVVVRREMSLIAKRNAGKPSDRDS